jgi:hypothetical protein
MKFFGRLFRGFGKGLSIGFILGVLIFVWPVLQCTGDVICGTVTCDLNKCEAAIDGSKYTCDGCNAGNLGKPKYKYTFIFSVTICTVVGGIWGMVDQSEENSKNREIRRKQQNEARLKEEKENSQKRLKEEKENSQKLRKELLDFLYHCQGLEKNCSAPFSDLRYYLDTKKTESKRHIKDFKDQQAVARKLVKQLELPSEPQE